MITKYSTLFDYTVKTVFSLMQINNINFDIAINVFQHLHFSSVNVFSGEEKIIIKQEISKNQFILF